MALPDFARVLSTYDRVQSPLARWLSEAQSKELGVRLHDKSTQLSPRIMVYGIYNAGKSTLLNALMGRADAAMADRPQTSEVTEYHWQDYTLLDTPGIDAPMEHEEVTRSALDHCDVVLFVVAAGGAIDEAATWKALINIVSRERSVMLIINNKTGMEVGSSDFISVTDKLRHHLQNAAEEAGIQDILKKVPIRLVNARTALKGRLENKPALVERSGLLVLEQELSTFLQGSGREDVFTTSRNDLLHAIEQAQVRLEQETGDAQSLALLQATQRVEAERVRLSSSLGDELKKLSIDAKRKAVAMIQDFAESQQQGSTATTMETDAADIVTHLGERLVKVLELELPKTQRSLRDIGQELAVSELGKANANLTASLDNSGIDDNPFLSPVIKDALKKLPVGGIKEMTELGVKGALELGKEWLPSLFKGIGPKTMGRWAGAAGRWAGPLVQAGAAIHEVYQAFKQEREQRLALERRTRAIDDAANSFVEELHDAYTFRIAELIEHVFTPVEEWLTLQQKLLHTQKSEVESDRLLFEQARIALR